MGKVGAFLDIERKEHGERSVEARIADFDDLTEPLAEGEQRAQASRCMYCGVAFCQTGVSFGTARASGCPLHNLIPEWNDLLWRGLWDDAAQRLAMTNPFPEFTGRVCPALCEAACNLGRDRGATTIKDDERAISDHEWAAGGPAPLAPAAPDAPRVTVVGSGPSGLACAWELARRGARVRVAERSDAPGGLLQYGIPNMKLPKEVVARRVALMERSGIEFACGTDVTEPGVAERLAAESDAVVIACGAGATRPFSVPGAELEGVVWAVDYLTANTKAILQGTRSAIDARDRHVVVIGGGDTGTDCVGTAIRQGCASVRQLEFLPAPPEKRPTSNPWPEWPNLKKNDYGQEEAELVEGCDPRTFAADTIELQGEGGHVRGLTYVKLDWSGGAPVRIDGTEETVPADLVLLATGFLGPRAEAIRAFGAEVGELRPLPVMEEGTHRAKTAADAPVFVAGDARGGASLVVSAIADGLSCAAEVAQALGL